ncbi:hypothetical protein AAFF_G00405840 [Aldrovandia affinis]|uniref:Uncharacterized protein n=1 Tax=Aldrovandia affinis TaxID=143900 RepID=A0AAD7WKX8_9TELE|nr:hypothetical protein AAFF_G00405840 [Aldrovandia affinis]
MRVISGRRAPLPGDRRTYCLVYSTSAPAEESVYARRGSGEADVRRAMFRPGSPGHILSIADLSYDGLLGTVQENLAERCARNTASTPSLLHGWGVVMLPPSSPLTNGFPQTLPTLQSGAVESCLPGTDPWAECRPPNPPEPGSLGKEDPVTWDTATLSGPGVERLKH